MKKLLFIILTLAALTGCNGLRLGVGVRGEFIGDAFVLDGDTFKIRKWISDSLFVILNNENPEENAPCYLLKYERNGFYYPLIEANSIAAIHNTVNYVCVDDNNVYDLKSKKMLFSLPCDAFGLYYLGTWKDLCLFGNSDTLCFSDGKCVGLQDKVYGRKSKKNGMLTLIAGAQAKEVSYAELHNAKKTSYKADASVERFARDYYIQPRSRYESVDAGFSVDLEIPKGTTEADNAIRGWMMAAIRDDAFYQLKNNSGIPVGRCPSPKDMQHSLYEYGVLWEKLCRAEYQYEDTLMVRMTCDIKVRKVADCDDYTTYYYWASLYNGGLHGLPREYYITYDKRRGGLLNVNNSVKPAMMQRFRHLVLESLKKEYDYLYEQENSWESFTNNIFSFHCPMIDTGGMDDVMRSLLVHNYSCDEWAGWKGYNEEAFTERDFPLTHFAVLPEGIVLTYHPYQIDCFAAGEYHAVIPFKDANRCLMFDYSKHEYLKPTLQRYIK